MADRHIDQDETKIYGDYAVKRIRGRVRGLIPEFNGALDYVADRLEEATGTVTEAVRDARAVDAAIRQGTPARRSALKGAVSLLGRFSKHLDSHPAGTIDRKTFFTYDGTAGGIGKGVLNVLGALQHIAKKLKEKASPVKSAPEWAKEFSAMAARLAPVAEHADNVKTDRSDITPEVETARQAWLMSYGAAKLTVEAVLRLRGRVDQMPGIFFDLTVSGNTKVTSAPDDADAAEPETDDEADETPAEPK